MSKRSVTEVITNASDEGQAYPKASGSGDKRAAVAEDEMGEFEDAWEDEVESDEEVVDATANEGGDGMNIDDEVMPAIEEEDPPAPSTNTFIPGVHQLEQDEILEPDPSVYILLHSTGVAWPCLSFDVLRDNLGDERQRLPATAYIVTGTQADDAKNNELLVYKFDSLHRTQRDGDDSDSENEDDDDDLDEDPVVEYRAIPHPGGVNRVRAQPLPASTPLPPVTQPYHVASWADTGKVHIWDVRPLIESLDSPGYQLDKNKTRSPVFTIEAHGRAEGFAMDWAASSPTALRLLTGDIASKIYLTTSTVSGFNTLSQPFVSHTSSIEDLQWSPSEPTVFASCSADKTVQIWDVRNKPRKSVACIDPAHESDVNVISWNRETSNLLLSGGDDGRIKVWDLRNVQKKGTSSPTPTPIASFDLHRGPITSVEWHPTDASAFAASGEDNQVSLWDLAVEQDDDEMNGSADNDGVPPQLLFQHLGQKHVKEVHWHPQIPGMVISTAYDGFNIFKTISI